MTKGDGVLHAPQYWWRGVFTVSWNPVLCSWKWTALVFTSLFFAPTPSSYTAVCFHFCVPYWYL